MLNAKRLILILVVLIVSLVGCEEETANKKRDTKVPDDFRLSPSRSLLMLAMDGDYNAIKMRLDNGPRRGVHGHKSSWHYRGEKANLQIPKWSSVGRGYQLNYDRQSLKWCCDINFSERE